MKKIPTVFIRDPETNLRHVKNEPHPECGWVFAGEGVATRKYDGTCVMWDGLAWWARREVKPGKQSPPNFQSVETDETTGKTVGWEPADQSGFSKFLTDALEGPGSVGDWSDWAPATFELVGPKINGNPEDCKCHVLVRHMDAEEVDAPRDFDGLREWLHAHDYEGVVWHHPDGRMAKIKAKDFPKDSK